MRLHHAHGSPHCASVRIALAEKGLAWESAEIDLAAFANCAPGYLTLNPSGQVPLLEDGACRISETGFILQYLDETYPDPPLGGADARARYQVHKWIKYVETHIAPNLAILRWQASDRATPPSDALKRLPPGRRALWQSAIDGFSADQVATSRQAIERAAERIAADLAGRDWLAGDAFTLADIAVYPHAALFGRLDIALPPAAAAWLDRMAARASVAAETRELGTLVTMGPERGRWG